MNFVNLVLKSEINISQHPTQVFKCPQGWQAADCAATNSWQSTIEGAKTQEGATRGAIGHRLWVATRSTVAAATTSKSSQSTISKSEMVTMPTDPKVKAVATSEMVTMPTDNAKEVGPRKPVFHPGLGVEGVILPPPITSGPKQSAISAAEVSVGAGTVGAASTATPKKKFSFTERRSAGDILQRHHNNAGSNLSADWLRKVEWATGVIPNWQPSNKALALAKRQRSQEAPAPSAKKSRVQPGRSFAQIAKDRILIGVLDRGNPDGRIPRNQWRWVESALAIQCFELLEKEPGPPPVCKDVGWYQGTVKVIACDDSRSAELYRAAVANVGEVYPGAKLAAVNWEDVPVRPRARMWIPSTIKEPEKLLTMIQRCNPNLPTQDWRVAKIEEMPGPTNQAVIILILNFGFSSVFIRVYKSDAAVGSVPSDKPVEEDITSELEAPERPEMDGYMSDASSLTRDLRKLWQTGDLEVTSDIASDDEDANLTVVEANPVDVTKASTDKPPPLNEDNTAVSLELQPAPVRLLACYMAYDQEGPLPEDITQSLISDCELNKIGLIVGCDANAHHTQWGSSNINARGELLLDYLLSTNLEIINRGNDPTFIIKDRKEVIDLTLVSHPLSNLITEWKVSDEHSFSDHRYIEFVLNLKPPKPLQFTNLRKTNWSKYQILLRKVIPEKAPEGPHSEARLHDLIKTFTTACKSACKASCPVSRPKGSKKPPWWTHNLNNLRKISRTLFNQAKASNLVEAWTKYKLQLAEYKKEIRRAKRSSWHSFCSEIESTTEAARLRKILSKSAPTLGYLKRDNDTWTTSSEESLEALLTKHFPGCSQHDIRNQQNSSEVRLNPSPFSSHNINWAINSFKPFKSPGPDGIAPAHLQHAEFTLIAFLDIEGAFNNVLPEAITDALTGLGIEGRLVRLINQLLTSRAVTSTLGSSTLTREEWAIEPPGKPGALSFYTDGSKLNNQNSHVTSGTISIYSDSQAAIRSIAATTTKSTSVSKCRKSLHEMAEHFDICLIWVPGHQDISGNCIADELARQGTTEILLPDKEDTIWWVAWPDKRGHTSTKPEPLPCVTSAEMIALTSSDP
ncbi:hypothetical protein ACLKA6_010227 [Drosophila palustris]